MLSDEGPMKRWLSDDDAGKVSRRAVLGGLAAAGVALAGGGVGLGTGPGRRALHAAGLLHAGDRQTPEVDVDDFVAKQPSSDLEWRVARTGAGLGGPSFAVVCLHGRGASKDFAFDEIGLHRFAADLGLDIVVASIDGGSSSYWHSRRSTPRLDAELAETITNASAVAAGKPVATLGWSMGGYGALRAAALLESSPRVSAAVAASPAVWPSFDDTAAGAFDGRDDFERNSIFAPPAIERLRSLPVRVDCGADDVFEPNARLLLDRLPDAEGRIRPGFHDSKYWRRIAADQLRFLAEALA